VEYEKKTLEKRKVTERIKCGRVFISKDNYGGFACHILKGHYGCL